MFPSNFGHSFVSTYLSEHISFSVVAVNQYLSLIKVLYGRVFLKT